MFLQTGPIRIAPLASVGGSKIKTLYLPSPDKDGLTLEWIEKVSQVDLIDGSPRTRLLGFVPQVVARWNNYNDQPGYGFSIGISDGQRPDLESLLSVLSCRSGLLSVSPGVSAGGFVVDRISVQPISKRGGVYSGLEVTLTGRSVMPTRTLGVF